MALLDFSDVLFDADLCDTITVKRRAETIGTNGRPVFTPQIIPNIVAVVTSAGKNDLERLPEDQRMGRNLCIVTNFKLRGPSPNYQPDTITWNGDDFIVKFLDPYPQFGSGFIQVIAGSVDVIDQPIQDFAPE